MTSLSTAGSSAAPDATSYAKPDATAVPAPSAAAKRSALLLHGPVLATLLSLAVPNLIVMLAQAAANFLESYYVGLLGVDALAGAALVFPLVMLMQMMSAGGIGGAISSAIARALGGGRHEEAEALALHAVVIALVAGVLFGLGTIVGGRALYSAMGGRGAALDAALAYSNVIFCGAVFLWLLNALASVLRGTGNMVLPAVVLVGGTLLLFVFSPVLIFGYGPIPAMGIAGAGLSLVLYYLLGSVVLAAKLMGGRSGLKLSFRHRLRSRLFAEILGVGGLAVINNIASNLCVVGATVLVAPLGTQALAGFGLGIRLEYLQIPIVFGISAGMVAMIGMNVGAGQLARARQIAWTGAFVAAGVNEAVGMAAVIFPRAWLQLFTDDAEAIRVGAEYLQTVAPIYVLYGFGAALYFASQGARRMRWSVIAQMARLVVVTVAGAAAMHAVNGGLQGLLWALVLALVAYAGLSTVPWIPRVKPAARGGLEYPLAGRT
ncbi:MATE family efflux transporter [soil metagenome]